MNETICSILGRRSIRNYRPDPISDADRDKIVTAGLYAASARNTQPWHITVVQNQGVIRRITEEVKAAIVRCDVQRYLGLASSPAYAVNFGAAPMFVIVSGDDKASNSMPLDCALVLGNMFLAAHSLGIGSCWVNQLGPVVDDPAFRSLLDELGVPAGNRVVGSAAFGYNAGEHPKAPARVEGKVNIVK